MAFWSWFRSGHSVQEDWLARLPEEKSLLFESAVAELESCYVMVSVALNEAFSLREDGQLVRAREEVAVAGELAGLLATRMGDALGAVDECGRHFGDLPSVNPLHSSFFRGTSAQLAVRWYHLLQRALLSVRSRFFYKISALSQMVEELATEFRTTAAELAEGTSIRPAIHWEALDDLHYDLNTCLRETIVLLKSFLRALPERELEAFQVRMGRPSQPHLEPKTQPSAVFGHRRESSL